MADDDGPNFSYAFGDAPEVKVPSWNPALRPDHESPVKTRFDQPLGVEDEEEDDLPTQPPPGTWKPGHARVKSEVPQSDDDFFDRYGRPEPLPVAPAVQPHEPIVEEAIVESATLDEAVVESATDDAWGAKDVEGADEPWPQEQEGMAEVNGSRQENIEDIAEKHAFEPEPENAQEIEAPAEQMYEHQNQEETVQDEAERSLLAETPAVESTAEEVWGVATDDFPIGGQETNEPAALDDAFDFKPQDQTFEQMIEEEPQQPDAAAALFSNDETTLPTQDAHLAHDTAASIPESEQDSFPETEAFPDLSQSVETPTAVPQAAQSSTQDEWGTSGEDAFNFGGDSADDLLSAVPNEVNAQPTEDLADAWGAALGDDDMLLDADAAAAFGFDVDDDDGFLEGLSASDAALGVTAGAAAVGAGAAITNRHRRATSVTKYTPANVPQAGLPPPSRTASYRPDAPNFVDLSKPQQQPAPVQRAPAMSPYASAYQQPTQQRPPISSAESFADKAKGGYHSPYDLPDDLAVKRRRPVAQPQASAQAVQQAPPPPRLSSMQSMPAMRSPPPKQSPMTPTFPGAPQQQLGAQPAKPPSRDGGFFADLPMADRPRRQATPSRTYSPAPAAQAAPPQLGPPAPIRPASTSYPSQPPPPQQQAPLQQSASDSSNLPQLRPAERMPLYDDQLSQQRSTTMPPPAQSGRYSPAVPPTSKSSYSPAPSAPTGGPSRYSPAPGAKPPPNNIQRQPSDFVPGPPKAAAQLYAPRTSSPLAHRDVPNQATPPQGDVQPPNKANLNRMGSIASISGLETVNENAEPTFSPPSRPDGPRHAPPPSSRGSTPPPSRSQPSSGVSSPRKKANYAPTNYQPMVPQADGQGIVPPRRSQTSSPSRAMHAPHMPMANLDRPASVAGLSSPIRTSFAPTKQPNRMVSSSLSGPLYHEMSNLYQPQDASAQDPLQRWKGAPIFHWGNGNSIVTSFPKYTPMYGTGAQPMVRPVHGDIKTSTSSSICPQSDIFLKFPGPLKKGKKKEVLAWLKTSTDQLEVEHKNASMNGELTTAMHTRSEERILLWRVMTLLVEHDGTLDGTPAVDAAVKALLTSSSPEPVSATEDPDAARANAQPEAFDPLAVKTMRSHLYAGEREKAVWHAVDQRLWAHALLIASTLNDKEIWKQVVQEFVRKEVRKMGENTEALAALYQVFAGNWEESIDELVSVSARSGFQMVSTAASGSAQKDALAGLDKWRETLLLMLNNRSVGDAAALASLGNLLNGYGRVEAGHICFLFARANARFGGADNPESHFSLVGGHTSSQGSDFGSSIDTILLSEVYEFALLSSSPSAGTPPIAHLQAYKLYHAEVLAEAGKRTEAQQYCDAITAIVTTKTNRSPYYNAQFMRWLDDFARRLSQAPADKSEKSWKPSIDKVSSSIWGKFNNFIAGEDSEGSVPGAGQGGAGTEGFTPMAMPPTHSMTPMPMPTQQSMPPMHRAVSSSDIPYAGGYTPNGAVASPPVTGGGRYAPGSSYTPRSSSEQQRPKYSSQSQSAYEPRASMESSRGAYEPRSSNEFGSPYGGVAASQYAPMGQQAVQTPTSGHAPEGLGLHGGSPYQPSPLQQQDSPSYLPTPPLEQGTGMNGYSPAPPEEPAQETPSYGYEPTTSYEPAPYQPYQPDEPIASIEDGEEQNKPKKKSFMDDDEEDDLAARAAALKKQQRAEADKAADEAFRKAAEADGEALPNPHIILGSPKLTYMTAAKGKQPPANAKGERGSWFGGWFGAKKPDPNMPTVHKAKLGEESSFVFDKELGRWVNKKAGAEAATPVAATPPPPKMSGPPSRPPSGMQPPPSSSGSAAPGVATPAKSGSPASLSGSMPPPLAPPQRSASAQPPQAGPVAALSGSGPPSRPPSRPSTSMSNASDIDDLLGPATGGPRKAGAKKGARKGRYVDVMAQK